MKTIKRRRHEGKTDFARRLNLLKSEKPRLVVRKSNRYILAQIVVSDIAQDKILFGFSSKDLLLKGWPKEFAGSLKSLPAAYLTGFALVKSAKGKVEDAILDIGLNRNVKKSRIYAVVKGAIDAGLKIPCSEEILPTEEEIKSNEKVGKLIDTLISKL